MAHRLKSGKKNQPINRGYNSSPYDEGEQYMMEEPESYYGGEGGERDSQYTHWDSNGWCCFKHYGMWWQGWAIGTMMFMFLLAVTALGLAIWGIAIANYGLYATNHVASGPILNRPFTHSLAGAAPLAMTLPNDLSNYIGREFKIYATTAQAHTVTIQPGALTTTWDGANTIATFGGAVGDGLTFVVTAIDKIAVISTTNIVFS